ncbi:hypothetical protein DMB95_09350 [Campylobacter sp. MIT 12-8780]|uniref:hypothetical protein n=1 Tax=unclassified Campylobacter TaxID=2593542 RepID=UPI0010F6AC27|nr:MULTISPECIES: hypothetical protein [unclassified Campylobacter]NDJ28045.1 hypothetical protein [Campylobacter sp. MIT 19-121]TKX28272.1 hypothetical protein CQA38_08480 [Campylobacter sp. MIT 12-5580]TQR39986.1 hypothetical protein DMB95_09350 [Campylobacter sp. MIT 12-8780]
MSYPLLGTHFELDEEKIKREGIYNLETMYKTIEEIALEVGLIKIDKNTYHCKGNQYDLAKLGILVYNNLMNFKWFTLNVKKWTWISEKEGNESLIGDEMGVWAS